MRQSFSLFFRYLNNNKNIGNENWAASSEFGTYRLCEKRRFRCSYKQWIERNLQTESQIPGPSEWLGMRSWNLSWRNAPRHKFAWRGSIYKAYCPRQYTCVYMYCLYTISWHTETVILGLFYYKIRWQYSLTHVKIACLDVFSSYINIIRDSV